MKDPYKQLLVEAHQDLAYWEGELLLLLASRHGWRKAR